LTNTAFDFDWSDPAATWTRENRIHAPPQLAHYEVDRLEHLMRLERDAPAETTLEYFFREMAQMPEAALSRFVGSDPWRAAERSIGTLGEESWAWFHAPIDFAALERIEVPIRLLAGSRSTPGYSRSAVQLADRLPAARLISLPGQGHLAHIRDAKGVATVTQGFIAELDHGSRFTAT
jgi:pimeloyl-ACP methyl ester carboxylesterase